MNASVCSDRSTTLNGLLEAPSLADVQAALPGGKEGRDPASIRPLKGRIWAKQDIPGHHLLASSARHQQYLDRHGRYHAVPSTLSFDFASKDRQDGIQYRLGVHKVSLQPDHSYIHSISEVAASTHVAMRGAGQLEEALTCQGCRGLCCFDHLAAAFPLTIVSSWALCILR